MMSQLVRKLEAEVKQLKKMRLNERKHLAFETVVFMNSICSCCTT